MYTAKTRRQRRKSRGINAGAVTLRFAECCRRKKISLTARGALDGRIGALLESDGGRVVRLLWVTPPACSWEQERRCLGLTPESWQALEMPVMDIDAPMIVQKVARKKERAYCTTCVPGGGPPCRGNGGTTVTELAISFYVAVAPARRRPADSTSQARGWQTYCRPFCHWYQPNCFRCRTC